ncbi:MAG: hypothetical protein NTY90_03045 [Candidatus Micrarchaeota archaeon]|nr:hypothetical protein [Candidatus Micrarchaeota archaeon]
MPIIVFSSLDEAGKNIARHILESGFSPTAPIESAKGPLEAWEKDGIRLVQVPFLLATGCDSIAPNHVFQTDLVIFASRHRSESGTPCLTVHATGNYGASAEYGGRPGELSRTSARALHCAYRFLESHRIQGFDPYIEATHHGPTSLPSPSIFVEVGSTENEWKMGAPAKTVAEAIMHVCQSKLSGYPNEAAEGTAVAIGFGGTHYAAKFSKNSGKYAFSHIAPKHALETVDAAMVGQMVEKTQEPIECAVVDWKGTNQQAREKLFKLFAGAGIEWKRT